MQHEIKTIGPKGQTAIQHSGNNESVFSIKCLKFIFALNQSESLEREMVHRLPQAGIGCSINLNHALRDSISTLGFNLLLSNLLVSLVHLAGGQCTWKLGEPSFISIPIKVCTGKVDSIFLPVNDFKISFFLGATHDTIEQTIRVITGGDASVITKAVFVLAREIFLIIAPRQFLPYL